MALIAPGAFLWITYQLQAAQVDAAGASTAMDIWAGLALALVLAFLTAISYAALSELYPAAGTGSSYYFAEKAFLDKEETGYHRWARLAKYVVGWISHLYYWVYPGVMVAMMATMLVYIGGLFGLTLSPVAQVAIAVVFSFLTGYVAYRGINGSTMVSLLINVLQIAAHHRRPVDAAIRHIAGQEGEHDGDGHLGDRGQRQTKEPSDVHEHRGHHRHHHARIHPIVEVGDPPDDVFGQSRPPMVPGLFLVEERLLGEVVDRKSTRLNSSH